MIGCEVRTDARLGLGYATALAALSGFYIGYLPYTLFIEQIKVLIQQALAESTSSGFSIFTTRYPLNNAILKSAIRGDKNL